VLYYKRSFNVFKGKCGITGLHTYKKRDIPKLVVDADGTRKDNLKGLW
jgi:hypothetical protein